MAVSLVEVSVSTETQLNVRSMTRRNTASSSCCATAASVVGAGPARAVGIAKGVGMIEPDMATMIAVVLTDAEVAPAALDALEEAMGSVAESLTRQIAGDGEGAETLIEVVVDAAADRPQAKRVAKAIVNSPLVKTAVHGADPNWGRVAMAIGKCQDDVDIDQERVVIRFGEREVYPTRVDDAGLAALSDYLRGDEVLIDVALATGDAEATVWGCDLTDGYVRINADYTT